ncbi:MAG TPA: hypothetical protein VLD86_00005, partial [Ilumatobacteraceae bacterium]|nr:hypothetical protein [Ilumatobacteraceae bacterium]
MTQHTRRPNRPTSRAQRDIRRAFAVLAAGAVAIGLISLAQSVFDDSQSAATAAGPNSQSPSATVRVDAAAPAQTAAPAADAAAPTTAAVTGAAATGADDSGEQDVVGDEP